jgi:hypothetical protein
MHRRPVGRSRLLAALGALSMLIGCFLPWFTVGGGPDQLTTITRTGLDGSGILVFAAAIATLGLVTLPYATERPVSADRWSTYAIIAGIGWLAFLYRLVELASIHAFSFREPADFILNIPGLWLAGIGLVILARATYEMLQEPRLR